MKSNGWQIQAGQSNGPSRVSRSGTQPQPCLPAFVSTSHAHTTDRPAGAGGRLQSWDHLSTDSIIQRGAKATAKADARRRIDRLANLTVTAFVVLAIGMAAYAIAQEERLAPHERHLLQQQR